MKCRDNDEEAGIDKWRSNAAPGYCVRSHRTQPVITTPQKVSHRVSASTSSDAVTAGGRAPRRSASPGGRRRGWAGALDDAVASEGVVCLPERRRAASTSSASSAAAHCPSSASLPTAGGELRYSLRTASADDGPRRTPCAGFSSIVIGCTMGSAHANAPPSPIASRAATRRRRHLRSPRSIIGAGSISCGRAGLS